MDSGSFGGPLKGIDALKAAMARRGMDSSALDQVSGSTPMGGSPVAPEVPQTDPQVGAMQQLSPQEPAAPSGATFRSAEAEIALKALAGVAKTENKIAESALKLQGVM